MEATSSTKTVLDWHEKIEVSGEVFTDPVNEYWVLKCLASGMNYLYRQVKQCEDAVAQELNPEGKLTGFVSSGHPGLRDAPLELLTISFHWYSVSACDLVKTIGSIAQREGIFTEQKRKDYPKSVIEEVIPFRDKIGAHSAGMTMNSRDNDAERVLSTLPNLTFNLTNNTFEIGTFGITLTRNQKTSDSKSMLPWSLTKIHERLQVRYWPTKRENSSKKSASLFWQNSNSKIRHRYPMDSLRELSVDIRSRLDVGASQKFRNRL